MSNNISPQCTNGTKLLQVIIFHSLFIVLHITIVCFYNENNCVNKFFFKKPAADLPKTTQSFLMLHVHPAAIKLELLKTVCLFHLLKKKLQLLNPDVADHVLWNSMLCERSDLQK